MLNNELEKYGRETTITPGQCEKVAEWKPLHTWDEIENIAIYKRGERYYAEIRMAEFTPEQAAGRYDDIFIAISENPGDGLVHHMPVNLRPRGKKLNGFFRCEARFLWGIIWRYSFTPDGIHEYTIDLEQDGKISIDSHRLWHSNVKPGMKCEYAGYEMEYVSENQIKINGNSVRVDNESGYTYRMLKTKMKGEDAAVGVFIFFDHIAESNNVSQPLFWSAYLEAVKRYGRKK